MIEAKELVKDYGELRAVDQVSFEIGSGECIGLLGRNGAGKTTLLRMLSCMLTPTSGTVTVDGADVVESSELVRKRIGYLPEDPPLYGEMTVGRFLEFAARLRGVPKGQIAERITEAGRQCRIEEVIDQRIETLSYGYRKRVGIAQAVVHRPALVILDEPIAGLDPAQIVEMRDLVRGLRGGHTVVLSSHILTEISESCDRILVMREGKIVASGSEDQLLKKIRGDMRLAVQVRGVRQKVEDILKTIRGLRSYEVQRERDGAIEITVNAQADIRAELSRVLVEGGISLIGLTREKDKLESVFLDLTGRGEDRP